VGGDPPGALTAGRNGAAREAAESWFRQCYAADPAGVWHAPGRVNFIGEHTDYNDGFVLPFALGQGVRAAAARHDDDILELWSRQAPEQPAQVRLESLRPDRVPGWAGYAAGVAWALREAGHDIGGARLAFDSDLAQGAGLSSSAALECATGVALAGLYGIEVTRPELALLAQRAENDFVGVPCGIMDQFASMLGERGHALLLDCRSLDTAQVPLRPGEAGLELLVIDTRAEHEHAGGGYADRRRACELAAKLLGVPALRDVASVADLGRLDDPVLRRRARHVVSEDARVRSAVDLLRAGEVASTGPLLTESHRSLRDDFEVSWPEADVTVETALAAGAAGARMTGGGFGGSVIALVPAGRADDVVAAVRAEYARRAWPEPAVTPATPEAGAGRLG
jgi:galactokinase